MTSNPLSKDNYIIRNKMQLGGPKFGPPDCYAIMANADYGVVVEVEDVVLGFESTYSTEPLPLKSFVALLSA